MKSLLKNVRILNFEDLLNINGGYSGSSGGGSYTGSRSSRSSSSSSRSTSNSSTHSSSGYCASSGGSPAARPSSGISSSYSASSGGTIIGGRISSASTYSSSSGNWNSPRVFLLPNGTSYSSLTGFTGPAQAETISRDVSRMNQRDFNYVSNTFGENACCATSLLNELSEIAAAEIGTLSTNKMKAAMDAAIRSGAILTDETIKYTDKGTKYTDCGYVANYVKAANAMAKEMGLSGEFYESSYNSSGRSTLIFAVDKNNDSKHIPDHFYASLNDHTYYDPWTGQTGDVSEFSRNGWTVTTRCLGYRKN
ncbi:MAG: hypothetical protein K6F15_05410 [Treponema sp.]|nr:hypothetical protein [Treponema sp.]